MTNQEIRNIVAENDINLFKINYKTGVHYGVLEDFFKGKTDELPEVDRNRVVKMLEKEIKK